MSARPISRPLALDDLAAPGAGLAVAVLDELLEALKILLDEAAVGADLRAERLGDPLGLPGHGHLDARPALAERLEADLARRPLAGDRAPADDLIGLLVRDLGRPLLAVAAGVDDPLQVSVVELSH
jgi:hypothetical protein